MDANDGAPVVVAAKGGGGDLKEKETVKVVVRCRPFSTKETNEGRKSIITIDTQAGVVGIRCPDNGQIKPFTFDAVYDETTSQRQFYDESGYPLVESVFEGYNGTIFAYGQTGCGKTHTMQGRDSPPELRGVIPLSFDHIFENIQADPSKEYMVRASYLEIYNEEIRDLLADDQKKNLDLKEGADGSVYVKDLIDVVVSDVESINRVMNKGFKNRTVGATLMNEGSSRSHSIFTVVVEMGEKVDAKDHFKAGKLNLVDLAGSERQSKTGATGSRLKEGCKINLSLSALGNVISALVDGKGKHIPYRDSKLTRLLQDSLGGNTKTLMVAAISPADYNYDETLSTLRYANRAKNIKNKPVVNEDPKDAKLREYKEEIERLKKMLDVQSRGSAVGGGTLSGVSTPTRPLSAVDDTRSSHEAERDEITRFQQEAAEMMERAKRMMEEAQALREQQQQPPQLQTDACVPPAQQIVEAVTEPSFESTAELAQPQPQPHPVSLAHQNVERVLSSNSLNSPKPGSAGRPASLPPIGAADSPRLEITPAALFTPLANPTPPATASIEVTATVEDPTIVIALQEAARVDAQAKAMMAKAEQLIQEAERRAKEPPTVQIVKEVVVKEVIPDDHLKEKAQLHELNASILHQKDRMGKELERTQQAMESYQREKEALHSKLKKIEGQILGGASARSLNGGVDSEVALLKQQVEYRRTQLKLREKAKKQAQVEAAKKALTIEKQQIEEELKTAHETAQATLAAGKKREAKYRAKLEAARQEVIDLNNEFERERENLLDTIREQTKESKLLEQLVEIFLPQNELVKVWERAMWLDDKEEWQLPKIKPRSDFQKIKLPTLGGGGGAGMGSPVVESGGAEVVSDDDGASTIGPSSARSIESPSAARRLKQSRPLPQSNASKGSSPVENGGFYSARVDDIGGPPQNQSSSPPTHRLLSPAATRLPSAVRQSKKQYEPHEPEWPPSKSGKSSKSRGDKPRRKSKDISNSSSSRTATDKSSFPLEVQSGPPFFVGDEDQLAPLNPDGYQPRDRLQSRQGSRQSSRQGGQRQSGGSSNTSSRTSLGEFDAPPQMSSSNSGAVDHAVNMFPMEKPPIGSRGSHSRSGASGSRASSGGGGRKHRTRDHGNPHSSATADGVELAMVGNLDAASASGGQDEHSPDASLIKKHKHKTKTRRDKSRDRTGDLGDAADLLHDMGDGLHLPRTTRSPHGTIENQDR